ncbi:MAG: tetratricopeptide repeat protein, partial [Sphingomicrobium sp.]
VFYIGEIAHTRGDYRTAESSMREYKRLALQMVTLQPDSMKFRMEEQYAETNLGVVLWDQRRFAEAAAQFRKALATIEAIATADPQNNDYQKSAGEALAWLGDAERSVGHYPAAVDAYRRGVAVLERLLATTNDVDYQQRLIPARRTLGMLYAEQGQRNLAIEQFRAAVDQAAALIPKEPANTKWLESAVRAKLGLAGQLLLAGRNDEATTQTTDACQTLDGLARRDRDKPIWQGNYGTCWLMRARLALAAGDAKAALGSADTALRTNRSVHSGDAVADAYVVAATGILLGDIRRKLGDASGARSAWTSALTSLPASVAEQPDEMAERAALLQRLGRPGDAQPLTARLNSIGYHAPV